MPYFVGPRLEIENREEIERKLRTLAEETDPEFAAQIVEEFRSAAPPMLRDLRDALFHMDSVVAGRIAHSLKSNCATFGLMKLANHLQALELSCKDEQDPPPLSIVEPMITVYHAADAQLAAAVRTVFGNA
jgi:HPt (histidine-containing phosphotransfer) domain-containing protein